jgi:hypothetical protein
MTSAEAAGAGLTWPIEAVSLILHHKRRGSVLLAAGRARLGGLVRVRRLQGPRWRSGGSVGDE